MCGPSLLVPIADAAPLGATALAIDALAFVACALVARKRPSIAIAVLVALAPFAFYRAVGPTLVTLPKLALVATILGLALGKRRVRVLGDPAARTLLWAGGAIVVATALSIASADARGAALRETLKSLEYLALFATVVVAARADAPGMPLRHAFAGSVAVVGALALAQEVRGAPSFVCFAGHPIPRVAGPLEGPNQLGAYLGIALCVVAAFAFARSRTRLETAALAIGAAALVATFSRAGLVAAVVGLGLVASLTPARAVRGATAALAVGALCGVATTLAWGVAIARGAGGFGALAHFWTLAEASDPGAVGTRSELYRAAFALWAAHPWLGIGAGNFELELGRAGFPTLRTHANSLYLQALVEGGLPLAFATLATSVAAVVRFARGPFAEPLVVAAFAASVGFGLHQIVDDLAFYPKVGDLWWIVLGLGAARFDAASVAKRGVAGAASALGSSTASDPSR